VPAANADDRFAAEDLKAEWKARGVQLRETAAAVRVYLLRDDTPLARQVLKREDMTFDVAMQPEGYVLVTKSGMSSSSGTPPPESFVEHKL